MLQTHTDISPCDSFIYHYWYVVKKQITDQFLQHNMNASFEKKTLNDKLALVKKVDSNFTIEIQKSRMDDKRQCYSGF